MKTRTRLTRFVFTALAFASVSGCAFAGISSIATSPGGPTGAVQYKKSNNTFGGETAFRYDEATDTLYVTKIRVSSVVFTANGSTQTVAATGSGTGMTPGASYYVNIGTTLQPGSSFYVLQARAQKLLVDDAILYDQYGIPFMDGGAFSSQVKLGKYAAPNLDPFASPALFIGEAAGYYVDYVTQVMAIGPYAGANLSNGEALDTFVGSHAGYMVTTGQGNTLIGYSSGYEGGGQKGIQGGHQNTLVGHLAGYGMHGNTSGNTFLGAFSGPPIAQYGLQPQQRTAIGYNTKVGSDGATVVTPDDIYYKFGVGAATPTAKLHVKGDGTATNLVRFEGLNCTGSANSGKLTADADGDISCADDVSGTGGWTSPATSDLDMANFNIVRIGTVSFISANINGTTVYFNTPVANSTQTYIPMLGTNTSRPTIEWRATLSNVEQYTSSHTVSGWRVWNGTGTFNANVDFNSTVALNGAVTSASQTITTFYTDNVRGKTTPQNIFSTAHAGGGNGTGFSWDLKDQTNQMTYYRYNAGGSNYYQVLSATRTTGAFGSMTLYGALPTIGGSVNMYNTAGTFYQGFRAAASATHNALFDMDMDSTQAGQLFSSGSGTIIITTTGTAPNVTMAGQVGYDSTDKSYVGYDTSRQFILGRSTFTLFDVAISSGTGWDSQAWKVFTAPSDMAVTVTNCWSSVQGGTSVTFNFEERARATPGTAGTVMTASAIVAPTTGIGSTVFSNGNISATNQIFFVTSTSAASGAVGQINLTCEGMLDVE